MDAALSAGRLSDLFTQDLEDAGTEIDSRMPVTPPKDEVLREPVEGLVKQVKKEAPKSRTEPSRRLVDVDNVKNQWYLRLN